MEKSDKMLVVKTSLGEDFRRFTVPRGVRLLSFVALLQKLYGYDADKLDLIVQYKDEEGDLLNVTSDEELHEAVRVAEAGTSGVLRVVLKLVTAGVRLRTVVFAGKVVQPGSAALMASPAVPDDRFDAAKKERKAETVEIKIDLEPATKAVKSVRIESTKSIDLPVAPRPNSVASLSASTAVFVKQFSDSIAEASSIASREASAITAADSDAAALSVGAQHERSRMITVPAEFVSAVTDLAAQTVALTNSYSAMTQKLMDPLAKETMDAANDATRDMAAKLNEDVAAIVKMLMETTV